LGYFTFIVGNLDVKYPVAAPDAVPNPNPPATLPMPVAGLAAPPSSVG
jgi:hypothetical protein